MALSLESQIIWNEPGLSLMAARNENEKIAYRCRLLRRAAGYDSATDFAALLGIERSRWANIEGGYPLTRQIALEIAKKVQGSSIDYLYLGMEGNLSVGMRDEIRRLEAADAPRRRANNNH